MTEGCYWVPHLTEIWALAKYDAQGIYHIEQPTDKNTIEQQGDPLDLSYEMVQRISAMLKDVSDEFYEAQKKKKYDSLIKPLLDLVALSGPDDICSLSDVNEAAVLHCIKMRYLQDVVYSNVGRIIIAMNPFTEIEGLYDESVVTTFIKSDEPYALQPHIFQVAAATYRNLAEDGQPQAVLITGESGSGKTESTKLILRYLATAGAKRLLNENLISSLSRTIMSRSYSTKMNQTLHSNKTKRVNPLLEAFGNATTPHNPNSSRFGKWMEIYFNKTMHVTGATIVPYLLELPRVTGHAETERTYHVFYQLLAALAGDIAPRAEKYRLHPDEKAYIYTRLSAEIQSSSLADDKLGFQELKGALNTLQFSPVEQDNLFGIVAAILHLGNVEFDVSETDSEAAKVSHSSIELLNVAAELLQIDISLVQQCIEIREVKLGGEVISIPLGLDAAVAARDGIAKLIYGALFDWLIYRVNLNLRPNANNAAASITKDTTVTGSKFVGLLDIAGFESFKVNGMEQLCINLSNEKLQHCFNKNIFENELKDYEEEGLEVLNITYNDNTNIVTLIEGKGGILDILDEELYIPKGTDTGFLKRVEKAHAKNTILEFPKIQGTGTFTIKHFAGPVVYTVIGWLEKNKFSVSRLAASTLISSTNTVIMGMSEEGVTDKLQTETQGFKKSVGNEFRKQLRELLLKINSTQTHFVRCIKPNKWLEPQSIDSKEILRQLRCSGVLQAIAIRKMGHPVRVCLEEFVSRFSLMYGKKAKNIHLAADQRQATNTLVRKNFLRTSKLRAQIEHICTSFDVPQNEIIVGKSKVFLTDLAFTQLEQYRKLALVSPVTRIQAVFRGYRVRKLTVNALQMQRQLYPLLGIGAAATVQGGLFLTPQSVILGAKNGSDLTAYVLSTSHILDNCYNLPEEFQPPFLEKVQSIFDSMRHEAEIVNDAERLMKESSTNGTKLSMLEEKALKHEIRHSSLDWVHERLIQLQTEADFLIRAEHILQAKSSDDWDILLNDIHEYMNVYGLQQLLTKSLRRSYESLEILAESYGKTQEIKVTEDDYTTAEDYNRPTNWTYDQNQGEIEETCEQEKTTIIPTAIKAAAEENFEINGGKINDRADISESSTESSEWSWSSSSLSDASSLTTKATEITTARSLRYAVKKFERELQWATKVLDAEMLDLLIESGEKSPSLAVRQQRNLMNAKRTRANLDISEWILHEIKEAVVSVVWGTNETSDITRLSNLIHQAAILGLDNDDVASGHKALSCLRAGTLKPHIGSDKNLDEKHTKLAIFSHGVLDFKNYYGLRCNQPQKRGFFSRIFHANTPPPTAACSHSSRPLRASMTLLPKQLLPYAKDIFLSIQTFMGDRPRIAVKDYLADRIIHYGTNVLELRDEIYLMILKQLTKNPNQASEVRGWSLLLYCCQSFLPNTELLPYVRYFLYQQAHAAIGEFAGGLLDEIGEIARQALKDFDQLIKLQEEMNKQTEKANEEEEDMWKTFVTIKMLDDTRQKVLIRSETTCADVVNDICSRFNMDSRGWTIMILGEVNETVIGAVDFLLKVIQMDSLSRKIIQSTLFAFLGLPQYRVLPDCLRVWDVWDVNTQSFPRLVFRRRIISSSEMLYPHPHHAHLTYKQLIWEFARYPFADRLSVLSNIVARILIAERWSPAPVASQYDNRHFKGFAEYSRAAIQSMAITYGSLHESGYIPAVYTTTDSALQQEWELNVQSAYKNLDPEEHQLLAINNVLTEMRRLRVLGSLYWLVIEPSEAVHNTLLTSSQLRAAYEGISINMLPGQLYRLLNAHENSERHDDDVSRSSAFGRDFSDILQPMVITEEDIEQLKYELQTEYFMKQRLILEGGNRMRKQMFSKLKGIFGLGSEPVAVENYIEDAAEEAEGFSATIIDDMSHICQPTWMAINSDGLHFTPAVSVADSNHIDVKHLRISAQQLFACEALWSYYSSTQTWVYSGLLFCVNFENDNTKSPVWSLIAVIPLSISVPAMLSVLKAFLPSLHCYGDSQPDAATLEPEMKPNKTDNIDDQNYVNGSVNEDYYDEEETERDTHNYDDTVPDNYDSGYQYDDIYELD